mmetsp:Transcript_85964/g.246760  ORF Transcript_85964/g.246760 Transcript_85964/m.246760 type:complete len:293 (+) Transcript_85964:123-1001(+)
MRRPLDEVVETQHPCIVAVAADGVPEVRAGHVDARRRLEGPRRRLLRRLGGLLRVGGPLGLASVFGHQLLHDLPRVRRDDTGKAHHRCQGCLLGLRCAQRPEGRCPGRGQICHTAGPGRRAARRSAALCAVLIFRRVLRLAPELVLQPQQPIEFRVHWPWLLHYQPIVEQLITDAGVGELRGLPFLLALVFAPHPHELLLPLMLSIKLIQVHGGLCTLQPVQHPLILIVYSSELLDALADLRAGARLRGRQARAASARVLAERGRAAAAAAKQQHGSRLRGRTPLDLLHAVQ